MKLATLIALLISVCAAEVVNLGEITSARGIGIHNCHPDDVAMVRIQPVHPSETRRGGMFLTTNQTLTTWDAPMSMVPRGTNLAIISTICGGSTSEPTVVQFVIKRQAQAPRVKAVELERPTPPLPPGLVPALPTNYIRQHRSQ